MNYTEITERIIGKIHPVGDSSIDDERFDNLTNMCELVKNLISKIESVAAKKDSHEASVKRAGEYAHDFIQNTWILTKVE